MFRPGRMGDSAGPKVTQQLMGAETSGLEIVLQWHISRLKSPVIGLFEPLDLP